MSYLEHEKDFLFPVIFRERTILYLDKEEAEIAAEFVKINKLPPPPKHKRLLPFGEGIRREYDVDGDYLVHFEGRLVGRHAKLKDALRAWDEEERYWRWQRESDAEQAAIDSRYYNDLTFDEDGYKVFKPKPLHAQGVSRL